MKFSLLATAVLAKESDFPSFSSLHAHCQMTVPLTSTCDAAQAAITTQVGTMSPGVSGGLYAIKEQANDSYVWVTRTTPVKKYVDDIIFEFPASSDGVCAVTAKSQSQTLSYYDYDTNYCNMYNVFKGAAGVGFDVTKVSLQNCKWAPTAAELEATCNKY